MRICTARADHGEHLALVHLYADVVDEQLIASRTRKVPGLERYVAPRRRNIIQLADFQAEHVFDFLQRQGMTSMTPIMPLSSWSAAWQ